MANAVLELAKTGRSKCATTGVPIEQGSPRVGFEIWRVGRRCMTYQTPKAFLGNLQVGVTSKNGTKCKFSGAAMSPGDLYVAFTMGGAKGEKVTSQICRLDKVTPLISSVIGAAGGSFSSKSASGFKALSSADQKKVAKAFAASSSSYKKRPAVAAPSSSGPASKRAKK